MFFLKSQKIRLLDSPALFFFFFGRQVAKIRQKKTKNAVWSSQAPAHSVWYNGQGLRPFQGINVWDGSRFINSSEDYVL